MKRVVFLITFVATCFRISAQPVLTAATNNPVIGDVYHTYYCDTMGVSPLLTGIGVTWNYGSLSILSSDFTEMVACSATPYCDSFPGSSLAEYSHVRGNYIYENTTLSALKDTGQYFPYPDVGPNYFPVPYSILTYPFTYGNVKRDSFIYDVPANRAQHSVVHDTAIADGYGTLILPTGTFSNVLRIKHVFFYRNTFIDASIPEYYRETWYGWYKPGVHEPLLLIDAYSTNMSGDVISDKIVYFTSTVPATGIVDHNQESDITIYPNPATDKVYLKLDQKYLNDVKITLQDPSGRIISTQTTVDFANGLVSFSMEKMCSGLYFLNVQMLRENKSKILPLLKN